MFQLYAKRLWDNGYNPIPAKNKKPVIKDWQIYNTKRIPLDIVEQWIKQFPNLDINITVGETSGITVIDVDNCPLDVDFNLRESKLPKSNVIRYGNIDENYPDKRRHARFFKYASFLEKITEEKSRVGVAIMQSKSVGVFSPFYMYDDLTLLEVPVDELDEISINDEFCSWLQKQSKNYVRKSKKASSGRNTKLTEVLSAMFFAGNTDVNYCVNELLEVDSKFDVPLFTDKSEGYTGTAFEGAIKFYSSVLSSFGKKENMHLFQAKTVVKEEKEEDTIKLPIELNHELNVSHPLLKLIFEYGYIKNAKKNNDLYIGAGLMILSKLAAHRYYTKIGGLDICSVLNIILIAKANNGKDFGLKFLAETLKRKNIGSVTSLIKSSSATDLILNNDIHCSMTAIIDEVQSLLKLIAFDHHSNPARSILQTFNKCVPDAFLITDKTLSTASLKIKDFFIEPHACFYGATTPSAFKESVKNGLKYDGLLSRILFFYSEEFNLTDFDRDITQEESIKKQIDMFIDKCLEKEIKNHRDCVEKLASFSLNAAGTFHEFQFVDIDPRAEKFLTDKQNHIELAIKNKEVPEEISSYLSRLPIFVNRLALILTVGRTPYIDLFIAQEAWNIATYSFTKSYQLFMQAGKSKVTDVENSILELLNEKSLTKPTLYKKLKGQGFESHEINLAIKNLEAASLVKKEFMNGGGNFKLALG